MGDILAEYPSSSNPSKVYNVIRGGDGVIYCNCTGWKMRKTCKHLRDYLESNGQTQTKPSGTTVKSSGPKLNSAGKRKMTQMLADNKPLTKEIFDSDDFQSRAWYQGCGDAIPGNVDDIIVELGKVENTGLYVAEPKLDGWWSATFTGAKNRFWSRNRKEKDTTLSDIKLPSGCLIIGELGIGTEHALERQKEIGHEFVDVYDLLVADYKPIASVDDAERRNLLEDWYSTLPKKAKEYFLLVPRFHSDFATRFDAEHEGLVLKKATGYSYTGNGMKVAHWRKAKKPFESDMVIMSMVVSSAISKSSEPMAESVTCGQYVDGKLKPLVKVGSMSSDWARKFATDFESYRGMVMAINHYSQFKSGALRHPSMKCLRPDKDAADCVFNPNER